MIITTGSSGIQRSITRATIAQLNAAADMIPVAGSVIVNIETGELRLADGVSAIAALPTSEVEAIINTNTVSTTIYGTAVVT